MNVMHFFIPNGMPATEDLTSIAEGWHTVTSQYLSNQWTHLGQTNFIDLTTDPGTEVMAEDEDSVGETAGGVLPAQVAIVVSLDCNFGRSGKGRIYLPGVSEGTVDDSSIFNAGTATAILDEMINWSETDLFPNQCYLGVYSRLLGGTSLVLGITIDPVIDTQRRRVERLSDA